MARVPLAEEAIDGRFVKDEEFEPLSDTDDVYELDFDEYDRVAPRFEEPEDDNEGF